VSNRRSKYDWTVLLTAFYYYNIVRYMFSRNRHFVFLCYTKNTSFYYPVVKSYLHSARVLYVNTYVLHTLTEISLSSVTTSDQHTHNTHPYSGSYIVFYGRVKGEINGRTRWRNYRYIKPNVTTCICRSRAFM